MRRFALVACLAAAMDLGAQSLSRQGVIPLESATYRLVDSLYLEQGMPRPDMARPWTVARLEAILAELEREGLSDAGRKAMAAVEEETHARPRLAEGLFSFGFKPTLEPEVFFRVPLGGDAGAAADPYAWRHGWEDRASLFHLPFELAFGEAVWLFSDISGREEHAAVADGNWSNLILDDPNPRPDLYTPFRALTSVGDGAWNLRLGRDRADWGNGRSGNLLLSGWNDFLDFVQVGFHSRNFGLTALYASMDAWLPDGTREISHSFAGHRLDFRVGRRLTLSLTESVALGGLTAGEVPDPVRDLNFMMIFHDWMIPKRSNSMLGLEASWSPLRFVEAYGQIAMDEFATQYELGLGGGGGPPIFGGLGGLAASFPSGGAYVDAGLEFAVTSPWLYNRRAAPYYVNVRRYWSLTTDRYELVTKPLGYRYGPDSIVLSAAAAWREPGGPSWGADLTWLAQGENTLASDWEPAPGDAAPTGTAECSLCAHIFASWPVLPWLSLGADVYWVSVRDRGHVAGAWRDDLEMAASAEFTWL